MKLFKKNENKKTTKLPMTKKVKKGFRYYCMAVMAMTFVLGTSVTAFAANDPIQVVKNPLALWDGSWDLRERPICTIPKPSIIIPTALTRPKMKS